MRRALLIAALAAATLAGCTTPRDGDRRDAAAPPTDGEPPLVEQCTSSSPGASGFDDDLDGAIDEGCEWWLGVPSALVAMHATSAPLVAPTLSDDKLRLHTVDAAQGALVVATRPSRDRPFGAPALVARWEGTAITGATLPSDELEVVVEVPMASLARATRASSDASFGALEPIPLDVSPPHYHPHLSREGTELFFVAMSGGRLRVHRAVRASRGDPFEPASVILPTADGTNELTPALTEDGRTLFVSVDGDLQRFDRASRDAAFGDGVGLGIVPVGTAGVFPFVSIATRELFYVGSARPWSPLPAATIFRAPICRDGPCPDRSIECESGVRSEDGQHCYVPIRVPLAWDDARADCEARDAHLATVASADEHALVISLEAGSAQWLGATDRAHECNLTDAPEGCAFAWSGSEEPFVYAAWAEGQPSGIDAASAAREDCLASTEAGLLDDRDCTIALPYVCERERYLAW